MSMCLCPNCNELVKGGDVHICVKIPEQTGGNDTMPKCYFCGSEMIGGNYFSYKDYGLEGEGIIKCLSCSTCNANAFYCIDAPGGETEDI